MKINDVFDVKRFWMVFRIDLMDNVRIRVLTVVLMGLVLPIFSLLANDRSIQNRGLNQDTYFILGLYVFVSIGLFFANRSFNKKINTRDSALTFYLLPASQLEKFISTFIITTIGLTIATYGIIVSGFHLAVWGNSLFLHRPIPPINLSLLNPTLITAFLLYLWFHSMFLFGGLYFKKTATIKTALSILIFLIGCGYLAKFLELPMASQKLDFTNDWLELVLFSVFFWLLTYIRLTETEGR